MGATFAVARFSLVGVATPERCWNMTLGGVDALDLSLILGGDGVCGIRLLGGLPLGVCGPLPCRSWIALFVSLRFAWWSTNLRLRSAMAAVNLPYSAADLSESSLLSLELVARNSCRDASCSIWKAANLILTSVLSRSVVLLLPSLSLLLSLSLSLLLSISLSSSSDVLREELRLVGCLLSAVGSTLSSVCFAAFFSFFSSLAFPSALTLGT